MKPRTVTDHLANCPDHDHWVVLVEVPRLHKTPGYKTRVYTRPCPVCGFAAKPARV